MPTPTKVKPTQKAVKTYYLEERAPELVYLAESVQFLGLQ